MSCIVVQSPGLFTTVQDLGREGFGPLGVSASGAADTVAMRIGNRLVGNPEGAAGLEMTLAGGTFGFAGNGVAERESREGKSTTGERRNGIVLALTGSDFGATLDDAPIRMWTSFEAAPGQTLRLGPTRGGARCYLCVRGAILAPPFLGSGSTHVLSGLGGWEGRALRKGDRLPIGRLAQRFRRRTLAASAFERLSLRRTLRVTAGPQSNWFADAAQRTFFGSTYRVAEQSNRTGLRLEGLPVLREGGEEMITEGVSLGAIQIPVGGRPILMFVEQQTTGGYPKIANVIAADVHRVGQLRPRDEIRFERVEMETARSLLREQEAWLDSPGLIER